MHNLDCFQENAPAFPPPLTILPCDYPKSDHACHQLRKCRSKTSSKSRAERPRKISFATNKEYFGKSLAFKREGESR